MKKTKKKKFKLSFLFSVILTTALLVVLGLSSLMGVIGIRRIGEFSVSRDIENVHNIASSLFLEITKRTAEQYSTRLKQDVAVTKLLATQIGNLKLTANVGSIIPANECIKLNKYKGRDFFVSEKNKPITALYWGHLVNGQVPANVNQIINSLNILFPLLNGFLSFTDYYSCIWIHGKEEYMVAVPTGDHYYKGMENSSLIKKYFTTFNLISRFEKSSENKDAYWFPTYKDITGITALTVAAPAYNRNGEIIAVVGLDINLDAILNKMLKSTLLLKHKIKLLDEKMQFPGFLFLMKNDGSLIAMPPEYADLLSLPLKKVGGLDLAEYTDHNMFDSSNQKLKRIISRMLEHRFGIENIKLKNDNYMVAYSEVEATRWRLGFVIKEAALMRAAEETKKEVKVTVIAAMWRGLLMAAVILVISIIISLIFCRRFIFERVNIILDKGRKIGKGEFDISFDDERITEIAGLADTFSDLGKELAEYTSNLGKEIKAREHIESEVKIGSIVQSHFLAKWVSQTDDLFMTASYVPLIGVSGDMYNSIPLGNNRHLIYIGDISGHGVQAALMMVSVQMAVKIEVSDSVNDVDIIKILNRLNQIFSEHFPHASYMTFQIGVYNSKTNIFNYFSAGHPPLILYNFKTGEASVCEENGSFPIGMFSQIAYEKSDMNQVKINNDTGIMFYTDGLLDSVSAKYSDFAFSNLVDEISSMNFSSKFSMTDELVCQLKKNDVVLEDDLTLLLVFKDSFDSCIASESLELDNSNINLVIDEICRKTEAKGVSRKAGEKINQVLTEHFKNILIYSHGNADSNSMHIYLRITDENDKLRILILDKGSAWSAEHVYSNDSIMGKVVYKRLNSLNKFVFRV